MVRVDRNVGGIPARVSPEPTAFASSSSGLRLTRSAPATLVGWHG